MESIFNNFFDTHNEYYPAIARVISGIIILPYGLQKLGFNGGAGIKGTLQYFRDKKISVFIAWLIILSQSLGSIALIIGFCTRFAAFGAIIIFTAAIFEHAKDGWMLNWKKEKDGEGIEYFILLLALLLLALLYGGGAASVDLWITGLLRD